MGRASSTLSPGHRHFAGQVTLQYLYILLFRIEICENFRYIYICDLDDFQTTELITEIELLEAEVMNHKHHVLSLYRSIFEQTISRTSSVQSSGISSPAHHIKQPPRKHPSVISNTFCSSNNFPLKPWHVLVTFKKDQSSQFQNKNFIPSTTSCSRQEKINEK